jgi:ribosomal protein S27AE
MSPFATPSPKHERVPRRQRYCTNCRRDVDVRLDDELCPRCHEKSLLPAAEQRQQDR